MAISQVTRDKLLVEARHRCNVCSEKCFEIHHIIEKSKGGSAHEDNLIVLCPNCHQHRYHRSKEFTPDQLQLYKAKLKEENEVNRRLLLNLEEIKSQIGNTPIPELEEKLKCELSEATRNVVTDRSPIVHQTITDIAEDLAKRQLLGEGARKAIELEFEIERQQIKAPFEPISIVEIDKDAYRKSENFPAAYVLELVLDRRPHPEWEQVFNQNYRYALYNMKRETRIIGDRIQMIVGDSDNLQSHADFAKRLVTDTNKLIRTVGFAEIDRKIDADKRAALNQYDTIQALKSKTKDLKL